MIDTVNQPRAFEILTAEPVRKRRKPRDWSEDEKGQLVAQTLLPGANVSAVARSAGVDPSQLYGWRRKALSSGAVTALPEAAGSEVRFARVEPVASPMIEIIIGDVVVRASGDVAPEHLAKVQRKPKGKPMPEAMSRANGRRSKIRSAASMSSPDRRTR